ncbi:GIY-YIG nuclease family protein [uncultured Holdemanella sp.]|uniref:GIY-YIG nuclease family protein n=1 Tax=uncultured Holdemanella sp. TaxID=1763549 RepID=UPI0025E9B4B4|nr:GIY-YIG nuclease family protein [uncultured Holdemanella sp.]
MDTKAYVYILECNDHTYYTGYTTDVENRLKMHNLGRGAKYTRARRPCRLVYSKACDSKSSAMKLEYKIKQLSRKEKVDLILGVLKEL